MGQKVHPRGFRLGIYQDWNSRWIAHKEYASLLHEDIRLRKYFAKTLDFAGVSHIEIERPALKNVRINIHTARPGLVIGKKGLGIETIKKTVQKMVAKEIFVNIREVRRPDLDAQLVAENVATQLKRRVAFRRAMKKAVTAAMRLGAEGIRIQCSGRLAGAEMARREWYREGRVPLHTLKADIDYGFAESLTTYGLIGVKVWMCKGDLTERKREN